MSLLGDAETGAGEAAEAAARAPHDDTAAAAGAEEPSAAHGAQTRGGADGAPADATAAEPSGKAKKRRKGPA